jgi:hypothetical protein
MCSRIFGNRSPCIAVLLPQEAVFSYLPFSEKVPRTVSHMHAALTTIIFFADWIPREEIHFMVQAWFRRCIPRRLGDGDKDGCIPIVFPIEHFADHPYVINCMQLHCILFTLHSCASF